MRRARIFISYGRQDAAEFAARLAGWLRSEGYEPWLDAENGILIGTPFDIRIEVGISGSDLLIALLSPWSLRPEGFCRNELLFALARKVPIIPIRIAEVDPPIQIISLNYVDAVADPEAAFAQLPRLINQVQCTGRMFLREWPEVTSGIPWWRDYHPLDFESELAQHGGAFTGRQWLFELIHHWVQQGDSRLLLLTADAGVGKSAIAAQMTARLDVRGVHFCSRSNIDSCRPAAWIAGLVYQLAAQLPWYREQIERLPTPKWNESASLFRTLIADPLRRCRNQLVVSGPWVFVVDGLDESLAAVGSDLADLLADAAGIMPSWLRLIITSRADQTLLARFRIDGVRRRHVDADREENLADLHSYITQRIGGLPTGCLNLGGPDELIGAIECPASGNFLFAKMTIDALSDPDPTCRLKVEEVGKLPRNLAGLYHAMFRRHFGDYHQYESEIQPLLECLVAARGRLPERLLLGAAGVDQRAAQRGFRGLSRFLNRGSVGTALFHKSMAEWLIDPDAAGEYVCRAARGHQRLAQLCWEEYKAGPQRLSSYSHDHMPYHLMAVDRWQDLHEVIHCPELGFVRRWVGGTRSDEGLACLLSLIRFLSTKKHEGGAAAGLATQAARIYAIWGQYDKCEHWLRYALGHASRWRERRARAVALHEMGSLALYRGEYDEAMRYYRAALRLCVWGIPVYHDEAAANLIGQAAVCHEEYRSRETIRFAARGIRQARMGSDPLHVISGMRLIAAAYKTLGESGKAVVYIRNALLLAKAQDAPLEAVKLRLLAAFMQYEHAMLDRRHPLEARESFSRAAAEAESLHDLFCSLEAKTGLCRCALSMKATAEADSLLQPLLDVLRVGEHAGLQAGIAFGLAAVAHQRGALAEAGKRYQEVVSYCTNHGILYSKIEAMIGVGAIEYHLASKNDAEVIWKEALDIAGRISGRKRAVAQIRIERCRNDPLAAPS